MPRAATCVKPRFHNLHVDLNRSPSRTPSLAGATTLQHTRGKPCIDCLHTIGSDHRLVPVGSGRAAESCSKRQRSDGLAGLVRRDLEILAWHGQSRDPLTRKNRIIVACRKHKPAGCHACMHQLEARTPYSVEWSEECSLRAKETRP